MATEPKTPTTKLLRISAATHRRLAIYAATKGIRMSAYANACLGEWLDRADSHAKAKKETPCS